MEMTFWSDKKKKKTPEGSEVAKHCDDSSFARAHAEAVNRVRRLTAVPCAQVHG